MNEKATYKEIEVKFHLPHPTRLVDRLLADGAASRPKIFETNICFDDHNGSLQSSGKLLRLRKDLGCRLTFKGESGVQTTEFKIFNELEVSVSDFSAMKAILQAMGYHPQQIYEKWRQTFEWCGVWLCVDTLPFGSFLEIEGPGHAIRRAADRLSLPWQDRIICTYLQIFDILRRGLNLPVNTVTFADFEHHPVDILPFLATIRAAGK